MGERGQYFCFFHRMLQEHASSQNDSCDRLTCEFLSALTVVTKKSCIERTEKEKSESTHKQNKETLPISAMGYNKESRPGVNLETTRKAEVEGLLQDFIRDTVFGHSGQLLIYRYESLYLTCMLYC